MMFLGMKYNLKYKVLGLSQVFFLELFCGSDKFLSVMLLSQKELVETD